MTEINTQIFEHVDGEQVQSYFPFIKIKQDGSVLVNGQISDQDIISDMNIDSAKVLVLPYSKMVYAVEGTEEVEGEFQELIEEIPEGMIEEASISATEENDISETMLHDHNYEDGSKNIEDNNEFCYLLEPVDQSKNTCDLCRRTFNTPASLKRHVRIHTGERPFQCQICDKLFSQQSNLWKHVRTHTGERPFECPHCNKRFSQRANMKKHLVIHTGERPFVCFLCMRAFTQQANLSKHMRLHTGEKPYACSYCDKRFTQRSNMQKHEHQHEGIKPYTCEVCFQAFTQQSNLKKHEMMHRNVKKYVCEICFKSYVQKVKLVKHKQRCCRDENAEEDVNVTDITYILDGQKHGNEYNKVTDSEEEEEIDEDVYEDVTIVSEEAVAIAEIFVQDAIETPPMEDTQIELTAVDEDEDI